MDCTLCNDDYYLTNKSCQKRTTVEHCDKYKIDENKCEKCSDAYYLSGT